MEKTITIRLTKSTHRKIKIEAAKRGLSIGKLLAEIFSVKVGSQNKIPKK